MKVALIGSGIAAVGVLDGLSGAPGVAVTLIEEGAPLVGAFETRAIADADGDDWRGDFYAELRRAHGLKFPPPKSHFGAVPSRRPVDGWGSIWQAPARGGLSNFWGASALALTKNDLRAWPIDAAALDPYYARAAARIGVSGRADALSAHFAAEHLNRPPIDTLPIFERLENAVRGAPTQDGGRIVAGLARLAVETRPTQPDYCRHEGACMIGCRYGAIYNARRDIDAFTANGLIEKTVSGRAVEITAARTVRVTIAGREEWMGPFDRIYLAAGCPSSTELIMRSLGLRDGPEMSDNAVLTFPIFYTGEDDPARDQQHYFGLTNLLLLCQSADAPDALVQIYPAFDHLWRYYTPRALSRSLSGAGALMRRRILIARLYLPGGLSQTYRARLGEDGACHWALHRVPAPFAQWRKLWETIRAALNRDGFWTPPTRPLAQRTSSHYAATFPLGGEVVNLNGEFRPGVFACDSTVFHDAPAVSPSLTSFALACRAARESL
jgi:choline dehydrogenase-like flavoprotein